MMVVGKQWSHLSTSVRALNGELVPASMERPLGSLLWSRAYPDLQSLEKEEAHMGGQGLECSRKGKQKVKTVPAFAFFLLCPTGSSPQRRKQFRGLSVGLSLP